MASFLAITDACDANEPLLASGDIRILPPIFQMYGQRRAFSGPSPLSRYIFEDNVLVKGLLLTRGDGRFLVVDGGGSMKTALLGGNLGKLAEDNGWAGIFINGCIRDVDEINACDVGVRALAAHPKKPGKRGTSRFISQGSKFVTGSGCMGIVMVLSYPKQSSLSSSCSNS